MSAPQPEPKLTPVPPRKIGLTVAVFLAWAVIVAWQMSRGPVGGTRLLPFLPLEIIAGVLFNMGAFWRVALHETVPFLLGGVALVAGLVAWVASLRGKRSALAAGVVMALGLAMIGDGYHGLKQESEALLWWIAGVLLGVGLMLWCRPWSLRPAGERSLLVPAGLMLVFLPLVQLSSDTMPRRFQPWNFQVMTGLMHAHEQGSAPDLDWVLREGTIVESGKVPLHMHPLYWWTSAVGLSKESVQNFFIGMLLLLLPVLYWWVESVAGRPLAVMAVAGLATMHWTHQVFRNISYVPTSVFHAGVFMALASLCILGRRWWPWLLLGVWWMGAYHVYAINKLLVIPLFLWAFWEAWLRPGERLRLCLGPVAALALSAVALVPTAMEWEEYSHRRTQFLGEHLLRRWHNTQFLEDFYGIQTDESTPWVKAQAIVLNARKHLIKKMWEINTKQRLWIHVGPLWIGLAAVFLALGANWRRWLLPWLLMGLAGPVAAIYLYDYRLTGLMIALPLLFGVPFAVAWQSSGEHPLWQRLLLRGCVVVVAGWCLLHHTSEMLASLRPRTQGMIALATALDTVEPTPVYTLAPMERIHRDVIEAHTWSAEEALSGQPEFLYVAPQDVQQFLADASAWGLPGTLLLTPGNWARHVKGPLRTALAPHRRVAHDQHVFDLADLYPTEEWSQRLYYGLYADGFDGVKYPFDTYLAKHVVLWGKGRWIEIRRSPAATIDFTVTLPLPGQEVAPAYRTLAHVQYERTAAQGVPSRPLSLVLNGQEVRQWELVATQRLVSLTPGAYLGDLPPGEHTLRLAYTGPKQEHSEQTDLYRLLISAKPVASAQ